MDRPSRRERVTSASISRAAAPREVIAPVAYGNMWGGQDDLVFDGHSFVVGETANVIADATGFDDALLLWDVPADDDVPQRRAAVVDFASDDAQVYCACVTGLRDYALKNGFTSIVLGVSGGIDSALTAAMAADAIGGANVVGVSMPSRSRPSTRATMPRTWRSGIGADYRVATHRVHRRRVPGASSRSTVSRRRTCRRGCAA